MLHLINRNHRRKFSPAFLIGICVSIAFLHNVCGLQPEPVGHTAVDSPRFAAIREHGVSLIGLDDKKSNEEQESFLKKKDILENGKADNTGASSVSVTPGAARENSSGVLNLDRPTADHRAYRHVVLPNKLEAILVSDPKTDRAACAMTVGVGSVFDPPEVQGLAHFGEHMLFLGTEKYPDEKDFDKFLQLHGGDSNAFTSETETTYFFSVNPEFLDDAADRFAQFFLSPRFNQSSTDREINAVHSEYSQGLLSDWRRLSQLMNQLANPHHPMHHFEVGNHQTLRDGPKEKGIDVRGALLKFYNKFYSANVMRLCILGRESLDDLEAMIRKGRFDSVKNSNVHVPKGEEIGGSELMYRSEDLGKLVRVVAIDDVQWMWFNWLLPEQQTRWESKPTRYMEHLFSQKGEGSLLSALKAKGLATALFTFIRFDVAESAIFCLKIDLTKKAIDDPNGIHETFTLVTQYVKLMSENSIQEWILDEVDKLKSMKFKFKSLFDESWLATNVALAMHHFSPLRVLSGWDLTWKRDLQEIQSMIKCLTPNRLLVQLSSKSFEAQAKEENWNLEPFYQTPFKVESLDESFTSATSNENATLHFPKPNDLIPSDFELKKAPISKEQMPKFPQLLKDFNFQHIKNSRAFFKQDSTFDLPKASVSLTLAADFLLKKSLKNLSVAQLYFRTLEESLREFLDKADDAGLQISTSGNGGMDGRGFDLEISGYNDRLPAALERLCHAVRNPEFQRAAFDVAKTIFVDELKVKVNNSQPYEQALQLSSKMLQIPEYLPVERLEAAKNVSFDDILSLAQSGELLQGLAIDALIQGNFVESDARELLNTFDKTLFEGFSPAAVGDLKTSTLEPSKVVDIRDGEKLVRIRVRQNAANSEETNNAVALTIQVGKNTSDRSLEALLELAAAYLSRPLFTRLRTEQQLGYAVWALRKRMLNCNTLALVVQSPWLNPAGITERIEGFLEEHLLNPKTHLSEKEFEELKRATIKQIEEKPKNIDEEASRNFAEILNRRYDFDYKRKKIDHLKNTTMDKFVSFLKTSLYEAPWFTMEISSRKQQATAPTNPPNKTASPSLFPLKPSKPAEWVDVDDDAEKFLSNYGKAFYEFPLPGENRFNREG